VKSRRDLRLAIQPLDSSKHDRQAFACGVEALDAYLKTQATQDVSRGLSSVYVATPDSKTIAGYYSLSQYGIQCADLPENYARKFPSKMKLPATLLGRLATSINFRGQGVGEYLLIEAIAQFCVIAEQIASTMLVVDAKNENATGFYARYGFVAITEPHSGRMFLPRKNAIKVVQASG